eukprot:7561992-Lingulodinium_polyedra.AAC.1
MARRGRRRLSSAAGNAGCAGSFLEARAASGKRPFTALLNEWTITRQHRARVDATASPTPYLKAHD